MAPPLRALAAEALSTKYLVAGAVGAALVWLRTGFMVRLLAGAAANSVLSKVLKRLFDQPRPAAARAVGKLDPGFPSSHAHMLFYLAAFLALAPASPLGPRHKAAALVAAVTGSVWRVRIERHTWSQVAAGMVSGTLGACAWIAALPPAAVERVDQAVALWVDAYPRGAVVALLGISALSFAALKSAEWLSRPQSKDTTL